MTLLLCLSNLQEPESVDKDILRRWYVTPCDPYDMNLALPEAPPELVNELARRYVFYPYLPNRCVLLI